MLPFLLSLAIVAAPAQAAPVVAQPYAQGPTQAGAANAIPDDSTVNAQARALSSSLRCPVCQGQSIQDSEAPLAGQMRDLIREKLRQGESPQQVRDYFVSKYGEWILLQPEAHGLNLAVYVLPILGLLLGGGALVLAARRWTRGVPGSAAEADQPTGGAGLGHS